LLAGPHSIGTWRNLQSETLEIIGMSHLEIECTNVHPMSKLNRAATLSAS